jgi:hypothetical protein
MAEVSREQKKVLSATLPKTITVIAGSIGSDVRYEMQARELSNRNFFMESDSPGRLPFTATSLIEIWLELDHGKVVFFVGRMEQKIMPAEAKEQGTRPGIAVTLVQIEPDDEKLLQEGIVRAAELREAANSSSSPAVAA